MFEMEELALKKEENICVSIVTATYNSEKTLSRTIESILNQTYNNIEYIIADGASVDNTLKLVNQYAECFEQRGIKLKVISSPDNGIYSGMNKGINEATGDIVGILNSDDWYEKEMVAEIVDKFCKTNFDICYCDDWVVNADNKIIRQTRVKVMNHYFTTRHWSHGTTFLKSEIYKRRLYDETFKFYADWDLVLWVLKHYKNVCVINKPLSNFLLGGTSTIAGLKTTIIKIKERYRAYRNNGYGRWYLLECILMDGLKNVIMLFVNG